MAATTDPSRLPNSACCSCQGKKYVETIADQRLFEQAAVQQEGHAFNAVLIALDTVCERCTCSIRRST